MIELEKRIKILMISTVLVLAALSGVAAMVYANGIANDTSAATNVARNYGDYYGGMPAFFGRQACGRGRGEFITVSQEFKDNVINITESDPDVQKLLAEGYNVTGVRPIINATVQADGTVSMKATSAIVTLLQNTTGRATVWVDMEQSKVTRIEILTITVIEKP